MPTKCGYVLAITHSFVFLGHYKSCEEIFCPQLKEQVESRDTILRVGIIQAATIVMCGLLVGSYMKSFNVDHCNALLSMIPKFAACSVSVIKKNVQLVAGEKNGPQISAVHVQCDATKCKTTVRIIKAQYNRVCADDIAILLDDKVFKLCELSSNCDNKMLAKKWSERARQCRILQKQFTEAYSTIIVYGVTDLDHAIDFGKELGSMALCEVL